MEPIQNSDPSDWTTRPGYKSIAVGEPMTEEWLDLFRSLMTAFGEARTLLVEAEVVLESHWFSSAEGESYNNDDVIRMDEKIKTWLESNR